MSPNGAERRWWRMRVAYVLTNALGAFRARFRRHGSRQGGSSGRGGAAIAGLGFRSTATSLPLQLAFRAGMAGRSGALENPAHSRTMPGVRDLVYRDKGW